jgi:Polyketide cyclase / dehydrase and lipid transport
MTFRTESRITIVGSVHEAWAYLCDVKRWPEWAPTVLEGRVRGGGPLQPGSRVEQRAKLILGMSRGRSQEVTVVEAPRSMAFAGPMGTSAARWGMEFEPAGDGQTDAMMWIEVDLAGIMRAIPAGMLKGRIQRVSDVEMVAIKAAVEADAREGAES